MTLFDFLSLKNNVYVPSKSNKQKIVLKNLFFAGILKVNDENSRIRIQDPDADPDPPQNVMDPQHCLKLSTRVTKDEFRHVNVSNKQKKFC